MGSCHVTHRVLCVNSQKNSVLGKNYAMCIAILKNKMVSVGGFEPPLFLAPNQVPYQARRHAAGGNGGNRTPNLCVINTLLCQLSYATVIVDLEVTIPVRIQVELAEDKAEALRLILSGNQNIDKEMTCLHIRDFPIDASPLFQMTSCFRSPVPQTSM